jgi:hypothetical protein
MSAHPLRVAAARSRLNGGGGRLRWKIRLAARPLEAACERLWEHPQLPALLPEYFARLYHAMRTTVPMMGVARRRAEELAGVCPVAARLVPYFTKHMREEHDHDVWLLADLPHLGLEPAAVRDALPTEDVAALMGALYYWVLHVHPVTLLAYFAVTEGSPFPVALLDRLVRRRGVPRAALRTLYKHARLDRRHGAEVFRTLDALPLTPAHEEALAITAFLALDQLRGLAQNVLAGAAGAPTRRRTSGRR